MKVGGDAGDAGGGSNRPKQADDQLCLLLKNIDVISEQGKGTG